MSGVQKQNCGALFKFLGYSQIWYQSLRLKEPDLVYHRTLQGIWGQMKGATAVDKELFFQFG